MEHSFIEHVNNSFSKLAEKHGLRKVNELNDGQSYYIEYLSNKFVIKIEKYRREFYTTLYKANNIDSGVNLFNLLCYLNQESSNIPKSEYFTDDSNLEECYKKQMNYISDMIYENFDIINDFFNDVDFDLRFAEIEKFMLNKYPNLFNVNPNE